MIIQEYLSLSVNEKTLTIGVSDNGHGSLDSGQVRVFNIDL